MGATLRQRGSKGRGVGSALRRDDDRERLSRSSFGSVSDSSGKWRNSSSAREEDQGDGSVCLDHSGIAAIFCKTVQFVHRSISNFVSKTSILQSVNNHSSNVAPNVELYSAGMPHRTAIRTVSGELDGGNTDF
jgi:hypothetical protein